ncbi:MAG: S9 family peptidase [Dehalococcoidia bacterium]|nr:S9 family peptidase [Dehalococcoidia bacterium]
MTPISPRDAVYGFLGAGDPQISPDGTGLAYVLSSTSEDTNRVTSHIHLRNLASGSDRALTTGGNRNSLPRWSPDGTQLAFVSDRVEKSGVFLLLFDGGEPREVCRFAAPVQDLAWSPHGRHLAVVAPFDPGNPSGEQPGEGRAPRVRVTTRIDYKQDTRGYVGELRGHVFVVDSERGERRRISTESFDHTGPAWSPDGSMLAVRIYTNNAMTSRLALIATDGGETRYITPEDGFVSTWAWSPGGDRIVYTGDAQQTWQADVFVYDVARGETRRVTTDLRCLPDGGFMPIVPPAQPAWLDERRVLFHAFHRGASGLWVIDLDSGELRQVEGELETRSGFSAGPGARQVAQSLGGYDTLGEIGLVDLDEGRRTVLTSWNAKRRRQSPGALWERFDVERDGSTTEAWLLKPPDFDPARKYPLVLDVHGGPNGYYGYGFNAVQQVLATNGFIVVYSNPRGSSTYGRDFTMRVLGDWGGEDYLDLMAVVDRACAEPYVDAERMGIWGYSYGGYMTAWTIAQNHRFKAAVCGAPCFDLESMFGTSDIAHYFGVLQWGGAPHEAKEFYASRSPSSIAHNTRTPTLIVHGEADERCPIGQGEQMFVTLKRAGVEVEFARYPGQSHQLMRVGPPEHREDLLARVLGWFQRHLGEPGVG